jgi:hypothetical protein
LSSYHKSLSEYVFCPGRQYRFVSCQKTYREIIFITYNQGENIFQKNIQYQFSRQEGTEKEGVWTDAFSCCKEFTELLTNEQGENSLADATVALQLVI